MLSGTDGIDFDTVVLQVGKGSDDSRFAMAASCLERKAWWEDVGTGWYCSQRYHFTSGQKVVDGLLVGNVLHMVKWEHGLGSQEVLRHRYAPLLLELASKPRVVLYQTWPLGQNRQN